MKGFALKFSDLHNWAIPGRSIAAACPPGWRPLKLGDILQQVEHRDRIAPDRQYSMAGVKWYGEGLFLRETVPGEGMSASQVYPLVPGTLIYNRLFAWKASFAVVPVCAVEWHVSNEFPQFSVDPTLATPEFLRLFCLTQPTLDAVNRASAGSAAVSRNRLKESAFLDLDIALPPLATQRAIVAHWDMAQADAAMTERESEGIEREATAAFLTALGFSAPREQIRRRAFSLNWSEIERWGYESNRMSVATNEIGSGMYPLVTGTHCLSDVSHGCSASPAKSATGLKVLKISAATRGALDLNKWKYAQDKADLRQRFGLREGDVLVCRTNGTLDYVGMSALVESDHPAVIFPDKLIRVRCRPAMSPAFLWRLLQLPVMRNQIEGAARTAVGNYAIGGRDLLEFKYPLPPLDVQEALVSALLAARQQADALRKRARQCRETASAEVEAMILGHMPAPTTAPSATPLPPFGHPPRPVG